MAESWCNFKIQKTKPVFAKPVFAAMLQNILFHLYTDFFNLHFADAFCKLLECFCCADEAGNHDSHYPQESFLPVSHIDKAPSGNLHCLCRQSLPGAVNLVTFPSAIFTKQKEEMSLKIMRTNYALLTQASL